MAQPKSIAADPFKSGKQFRVPKTSVTAPSDISVGAHGPYQVKSGFLGGVFVARAFPKAVTNAQGMIAEATGATKAEAEAALYDLIDAREAKRTRERRIDPLAGIPIPSVDEYREAIGQVTLSKPQRLILGALSLAGEEGLSDQDIANAAGYKSKTSAYRALSSAGRLVAEFLSVSLDLGASEVALDGSAILGIREPRDPSEADGVWILHRELSDAVRETL